MKTLGPGLQARQERDVPTISDQPIRKVRRIHKRHLPPGSSFGTMHGVPCITAFKSFRLNERPQHSSVIMQGVLGSKVCDAAEARSTAGWVALSTRNSGAINKQVVRQAAKQAGMAQVATAVDERGWQGVKKCGGTFRAPTTGILLSSGSMDRRTRPWKKKQAGKA